MGLVDTRRVPEEGQVMLRIRLLRVVLAGALVCAAAWTQSGPVEVPKKAGPAPRVAPKGGGAVKPGAASTPRANGVAATVEHQLRERVQLFYQLTRDGKMLAATELVVPDSKDIFLASEKPKMDSLEIAELEWLEGGREAKVSAVGQTTIAVAGQRVPSRTVFDSYWKRVGGVWMYFDPPVRQRKTPFGVVKVDRDGKLIGGASVDLKAKVDAATAAAMVPDGKAFSVEAKDVAFSLNKPGSAEFKVNNGSRGYLNVYFGGADLKGLQFEPATATVAPGQTAVFRLIWTPGEKPEYGQDWGSIVVQPWNKRTQFRIRWAE